MGVEAGLKSWECEAISPNEVWMHINGYDMRQRQEWERLRMDMYNTHIHSMADAKKKSKSAQKFFPLPWDEKSKTMVSNPKAVYDRWLAKNGRTDKNIHKG